MAINFDSFQEGTTSTIQSNDYVVGFDTAVPGGERKWTVSTIANAVSGIITPALVETPAFTGTFKNKIINGNFDIWQRGTSLAPGTGGRYLADRFTNGSVTTTNTPSQQAFGVGQTDVPNQPDFFHRTVVSSGSVAGCNATLHQHIESVKTFAGKTVTLSFWAKATTAPENVAIEFHQYFGTGGSTAVSIPAGLFALTTSWQKFTVTANIPNINGKTIGASNDDYLTVYFWFDAGANFAARASNIGYQSGTFDIAQVQLEEGSVATPFELRPIGTELALCQRYYEKSYDLNIFIGDNTAALSNHGGAHLVEAAYVPSTTSGLNFYINVFYKIAKRATPFLNCYSLDGSTPNRFWDHQNLVSRGCFPFSRSITCATFAPSSTLVAPYALINPAIQTWWYTGGDFYVHWTADAEL